MTVELFIQSIIIYSLFGFGMYWIARVGVKGKDTIGERNVVPIMTVLCCLLLFAVMSGIRWGVGVDYYSYLNGYESLQNTGLMQKEHESEPIWDSVTKFLALHNFHYTFFFGFWAFVQIFFICITFKSRPAVFPYVALFCVLASYYLTMMNGIRQATACCIFIYAAQFIPKRKLSLFVVFLLLASAIHKSAMIIAPLYLFAYEKTIWNKRWVLFLILGVCVLLGYTPFITRMLDKATLFLDMLNYDSYIDRFDAFSDESRFSNAAWGPSRLSKFLVGVIIISLYPKVSEYFKDDYVDFAFKLFFIGLCVSNIAINTYYLFLRPFWYFTFFGLPMSAFTVTYLYKQGPQKRRLYLILLFLTMVPLYWAVYKGYSNPMNRDSIYQFYFDDNKVYLRPY